MDRLLYDLAGADPDLRFSQHCWRVRLALYHKGLVYDSRPWRFSEKDEIAFAGTDRVPVLVDGETVVTDSWAILEYLEDTYPEGDTLFGCADARNQSRFFKAWTESIVHAGLGPMIMRGIHDRLHPDDQAYFRRTREARFGLTLEQMEHQISERLPEFHREVMPLRATLEVQPYVGGPAPLVPDILLYAACLWVRHGAGLELFDPDDPIAEWRDRMDHVFAGA